MALLEVNDLHVHFHTFAGTAKVLDGISFTMDEGDTLGLVGESGCGKSVTAQAIIGLLPRPPAEVVRGTIRFGGEDLLRKTEAEMRALRGTRISMVFQDPMTYLNPVFSIEEQLTDVILAHRAGSPAGALGLATRRWSRKEMAEARRSAVSLLRQVNIPEPEERLGHYPHEFSGGMRQRVLLAMALAGSPRLLLADEPTTALDVTIQAQILRLLRRLIETQGISVLLISHDLAVISRSCRRVAVMYAGTIAEAAEIDRIFRTPLHPYTQGLLRSIPRNVRRQQALEGIPGFIPNLVTPPPGCRFHPRCPKAMEVCREVKPVPVEVEPGHTVSCHLFSVAVAGQVG
ncbi:MAG: peptide ABC transporter ATP-binding protein [candidate division NC10 bacterium RBG_16_65_8]|nr:MAG: peptide ABC transporter ATP-binding protein [candidate division NC10 bacterium RBG_16_65_8]